MIEHLKKLHLYLVSNKDPKHAKVIEQLITKLSSQDDLGNRILNRMLSSKKEKDIAPTEHKSFVLEKNESEEMGQQFKKMIEEQFGSWDDFLAMMKPKDSEPIAKTWLPKNSDKKSVLIKMANLADFLDDNGFIDQANLIDSFINKYADPVLKDEMDWKEEDKNNEQSKRYDSKHHHTLQIREPKKTQERPELKEYTDKHHVTTFQPVKEAASQRTCPDHIGVMLGRVGESQYQCPLDGSIYDWEAGWIDYDGEPHAGGSVAAQTPESSSDFAVPSRLFDSRTDIINRIN